MPCLLLLAVLRPPLSPSSKAGHCAEAKVSGKPVLTTHSGPPSARTASMNRQRHRSVTTLLFAHWDCRSRLGVGYTPGSPRPSSHHFANSRLRWSFRPSPDGHPDKCGSPGRLLIPMTPRGTFLALRFLNASRLSRVNAEGAHAFADFGFAPRTSSVCLSAVRRLSRIR
jgi:hypothetical protein